MSHHQIIVSQESLKSPNTYDIVNSNVHYISQLFQHNLHEDAIYEDALKSYYVDYYYSFINCDGFERFIKEVNSQETVQYYIRTGLEALRSEKHLELFTRLFPKEGHATNYRAFALRFRENQKSENLPELNAQWLMQHPHLLTLDESEMDYKIKEHLNAHTKDARHITIIKQLCNIIDEAFIAVTAGDARNIYNRSWHFKTTQSYYYMIEKENIVTLYNSFTKEAITRGRLVANKASFPNFFSRILA